MSQKTQRYEDKVPETVHDRKCIVPKVDIYENDHEIQLMADIPGVNKDGLKIHLDNEKLTLDGKTHEETHGSLLGQEYETHDFRRTFTMPPGIDGTKISADLKQGVLCLHLPKSPSLQPRQIEVKAT